MSPATYQVVAECLWVYLRLSTQKPSPAIMSPNSYRDATGHLQAGNNITVVTSRPCVWKTRIQTWIVILLSL